MREKEREKEREKKMNKLWKNRMKHIKGKYKK